MKPDRMTLRAKALHLGMSTMDSMNASNTELEAYIEAHSGPRPRRRTWDEMRKVVEELKAFAKERNVVIVCPVQAPRPANALPPADTRLAGNLVIIDYCDVLQAYPGEVDRGFK